MIKNEKDLTAKSFNADLIKSCVDKTKKSMLIFVVDIFSQISISNWNFQYFNHVFLVYRIFLELNTKK
jgi:hypothetical protein